MNGFQIKKTSLIVSSLSFLVILFQNCGPQFKFRSESDQFQSSYPSTPESSSEGSGTGSGVPGAGDGDPGPGDGAGSPTPTHSCPSGYASVPGDVTLGVGSFCVMQYEAKAVTNSGNNYGDGDIQLADYSSYKPASTADHAPWHYIRRKEAISECASLGQNYDLITNDQWLTIARNIEGVGQNWTGGATSTGCLFQGNNGENNCGYDGSTMDYGTSRNARSKFTLSNGQELWDFAGNLAEWTKDDNSVNYNVNTYMSSISITNSVVGLLSAAATNTMRNAKNQFGPANTYTGSNISNNYHGLGYGDLTYTSGHTVPNGYYGAPSYTGTVLKGGDYKSGNKAGVFATTLAYSEHTSGSNNNRGLQNFGFRCVYYP